MDCPRVAICAEFIATTVHDESFFTFRKQNEPADWWLGGGYYETVIPASVASVNCAGRETTNAICLQPFAPKRRVQVAANIFCEANHDVPSREAAAAVREATKADMLSVRSMWEIVGARKVWNCTRSFVNRRSRVQSSATRSFFSNRGSLLK